MAPLIEQGLLTRVVLTDSERDLFVELAADIDDGEAQVIAVAVERGMTPATDDRPAAREATGRLGRVLGTPEILKRWQEDRGVPAAEIRDATQQVERRARFRPRRNHPLATWWDDPVTVTTEG